MEAVRLLKFKDLSDDRGVLVPIEALRDIPFEIRRVYCISDIPSNFQRGFHAHKQLEQVLICVKGSALIHIEDACGRKESIFLQSPLSGLYLGANVWHFMDHFSEDAVLLVLASDYYEENDYIREYCTFLTYCKEIGKNFRGGG